MTNITIERYIPSYKDYKRVDELLTNFSKSRGGVDYESKTIEVFSVVERGDRKANTVALAGAQFLSWGSVTIPHIKYNQLDGLDEAVAELSERVMSLAKSVHMSSITVKSKDPHVNAALDKAGFVKHGDVPLENNVSEAFYIHELDNDKLPTLDVFNKKADGEDSYKDMYSVGFKALDDDGNTFGEIIALYRASGEFEIERIYVDHAARGQGVGHLLMQSTEKFAKHIHAKAIMVASPTWQQGRVGDDGALYESENFTRLAKQKLSLSERFKDNERFARYGAQYNVYYKKELGTTGNIVTAPEHRFV